MDNNRGLAAHQESDAGMVLPMFQWLVPRRRAEIDAFPLGTEGQAIDWHLPVAEVRWKLGQLGILGLDIDGYPSVRMKFPDRTLRASLEFMEGTAIGDTWFSATTGATLRDSRGEPTEIEMRLRGGQIGFPDRNPRANWKWVLDWIGKPAERSKEGVWIWEWPQATARYWETPPGEPMAAWLRFQARSGSRVLEIVNQSSLELYRDVGLQLHFGDGSWVAGTPPRTEGVSVRLHWDVPRDRSVRLVATAGGSVATAEVPVHARRALLANDGRGGVRIVV